MKKSQLQKFIKEVIKEIVTKFKDGYRFDAPQEVPDEVVWMMRNLLVLAKENGFNPRNLRIDFAAERDENGTPVWFIISSNDDEYLTFNYLTRKWHYKDSDKIINTNNLFDRYMLKVVQGLEPEYD